MKVGFIGLGVMGLPMAQNLINAGHELVVHRVKDKSRSLIDAGANPGESPADVANRSDVVVLMLPDTPDVKEVLTGADGVLAGLAPGSLVIDMSSISPVETLEFARATQDAGSEYIDAPVSGGEAGAIEGALTIFVGGAQAAVDRAMPLLHVLGATITHLGDVGAGQTTKVANQMIVAQTIEAVAEGLALAQASGIDPALVQQALSGGFAASKILQAHGSRMIEGSFEPGFRIRLHRKDLRLALAAAEHLAIDVPGTRTAAAQMDQALADELGELDHSALYRLLSK